MDRLHLDWRKWVGHEDQMASVTRMMYTQGRADGVKAIEVNTGAGLCYTVTESRCLDLYKLSWKGINFSFIGKPGLAHPAYFSSATGEFSRLYHAGMLYTCGMRNVGTPDADANGGMHPQHGRASFLAAEHVQAIVDWDKGITCIKGSVREAALFGEHIVLERTITSPIGGDELTIEDCIINRGYAPEGLMLLYHINFGYPMLSEHTRVSIPGTTVEPRDAEAAGGIASWNTFHAPVDGYREQVFYHDVDPEKDNRGHVEVYNQALHCGMALEYPVDILPNLVEWKSMMSGDYALGIEPATCRVGGRSAEDKSGRVRYLEAGESLHIRMKMKIIE